LPVWESATVFHRISALYLPFLHRFFFELLYNESIAEKKGGQEDEEIRRDNQADSGQLLGPHHIARD
jgi:hypothetical protein